MLDGRDELLPRENASQSLRGVLAQAKLSPGFRVPESHPGLEATRHHEVFSKGECSEVLLVHLPRILVQLLDLAVQVVVRAVQVELQQLRFLLEVFSLVFRDLTLIAELDRADLLGLTEDVGRQVGPSQLVRIRLLVFVRLLLLDRAINGVELVDLAVARHYNNSALLLLESNYLIFDLIYYFPINEYSD